MRSLVAAVALVAALALGGIASAGDRPSAAGLEGELVCPVCKTTLDQSDSPIAERMKQLIRQRIAQGWSAERIKAEFVEEWGPGVIAEPPRRGFDLLAWALPLAVGVAGAAFVGALAVTWRRRRSDDGAGDAGALDPELERRLDAELRRFES